MYCLLLLLDQRNCFGYPNIYPKRWRERNAWLKLKLCANVTRMTWNNLRRPVTLILDGLIIFFVWGQNGNKMEGRCYCNQTTFLALVWLLSHQTTRRHIVIDPLMISLIPYLVSKMILKVVGDLFHFTGVSKLLWRSQNCMPVERTYSRLLFLW